MKIQFHIIYIFLLFLITAISCAKKNNNQIFYKQLNDQYVFITDVNALQASDDPISNHIDSILSGLINTSIISTGKQHIYIDENELPDLYFEIIDLNEFNANNLPTGFDSLAARAGSNTVQFLDNSTWHYADALNYDDEIGPNALWSENSVVLGTFANAGNLNGKGNKYMGFRLPNNGNYHYGWIKLNCSQHNDTLTIYEFGYHKTVNRKIKAGQHNDADQ